MSILSTAAICDALASRGGLDGDVHIFPSEFPIFSASHYLRGIVSIVFPGGPDDERREKIAQIILAGHIVVVDNEGRTACSCFEPGELTGVRAHSNRFKSVAGVIVNGAVRGSSIMSEAPYSIRARAAHPWPFRMNQEEPAGRMLETFPFGTGAYVVGDGDGLIVMRNADVLQRIGL
jgi:regulator of RNase E activity RraA